MSALIKSGGSAGVRAFSVRTEPLVIAAPADDPRDAECRMLRVEVERLTETHAAVETRFVQAVRDAYEEGRRTGVTEAAALEDDRLDALRHGVELAVNLFEARLEVLDYLAPALVRASLEKLFDAPEQWSAMSEAMLLKQLRELRRASVVAIHVSPDDFSQDDKIEALSARGTRVEVDAELRSGACRIECKLGQIDLDIRDQWGALAALLGTMGEGE